MFYKIEEESKECEYCGNYLEDNQELFCCEECENAYYKDGSEAIARCKCCGEVVRASDISTCECCDEEVCYDCLEVVTTQEKTFYQEGIYENVCKGCLDEY